MDEINEQLDQLQASIEQRFKADMRDPEVIALSKRLDELADYIINKNPLYWDDPNRFYQWYIDLKTIIIPSPIADDAPPTN